MKGILMRPEVWQAKLKVLEHGEAQTRRLDGLKEINLESDTWELIGQDKSISTGQLYFVFARLDGTKMAEIFPRYQVGEVVYVKEAWATEKRYDPFKPSELPYYPKIFYVSDGVGEWPSNLSIGRLRFPLHLPEEFARYFIKITDVRAERLQEITEEDAIAEGCTIMAGVTSGGSMGLASARYAYRELWNSINPKYPWESNPWVWVYTFTKAEQI